MVAIDDALDITASPEEVWQVLTDFNGYSRWNPFVTRAKGSAKEGDRIELLLKPFPPKDRILQASIGLLKEPAELRWSTYVIPAMLKWEHTLHVEDFHEGHVCIVQRAVFSGILAGRYEKKLKEHFKSGLAAMNQAIKERSESGVHASRA
jgi:hypothetical protein